MRELLSRRFGMWPGRISIERFLCIDHGMSDAELTLFAVGAYAMFRATSRCRGSTPPQASRVYDMLEEYCKAGVSGHARSRAVLFP